MFSLPSLLDYIPFRRVEFVINSAQKFINNLRCVSNAEEQATIPFGIFPLDDFQSDGNTPLYVPQDGTRLSVSPLHLAAAYGKEDVLALLLSISNINHQPQGQSVTALSLALYCGHLHLARMILEHGVRPERSSLHAAARRGLRNEIVQFVQEFEIDPDIEDQDGATPIVYALQLPEEEAWATICLFFFLGARKDFEVGDNSWLYADLAKSMGKDWLAAKLEEVSDDSSSHTMDLE